VYIWEKARTCAASGLHHNPSSGVEWTVPGVIEDGFVVIPCHGKRMSLTEYFGYPNEPPHRLLPFSLNGKWGYVLFKTGNVVVEPRWAKRPGGWGDIRVYWWKYRGRLGIHHPTRPYSPLKKDRCGFKDWDGNVVIEPVYDDAIDFYGEFTAAKLNGKWGLIDQKGNSVFPFDWDDVLNFWDYNCPAGPALDSRREELLPYFAFMRGNECCFFTPEWKPLIKPRESSLIYFPEK
jgi:hypothetical protein